MRTPASPQGGDRHQSLGGLGPRDRAHTYRPLRLGERITAARGQRGAHLQCMATGAGVWKQRTGDFETAAARAATSGRCRCRPDESIQHRLGRHWVRSAEHVLSLHRPTDASLTTSQEGTLSPEHGQSSSRSCFSISLVAIATGRGQGCLQDTTGERGRRGHHGVTDREIQAEDTCSQRRRERAQELGGQGTQG